MRLDLLGLVVHREIEIAETLVDEAADKGFQDGARPYPQHRLGGIARQLAQAASQAAGHDHHPFVAFRRDQVIVDRFQADNDAPAVEHRHLVQRVAPHLGEPRLAVVGVAHGGRGRMHHVPDQRTQCLPFEQGAADIAVADRTEEMARLIDDEGDLAAHFVNGFQRGAHGGGRCN